MPRAKPFKYTYEKEIVMYAYHKKLDYFATECVSIDFLTSPLYLEALPQIYSPNAYRGHARELIKNLEAINPSTIIDIIHSAEYMKTNGSARKLVKQKC